jgi:hypothetical protein
MSIAFHVRRALLLTSGALFLAPPALAQHPAPTGKTYQACYVPSTGTVYIIGETGMDIACGRAKANSPDVPVNLFDGGGALRTTDLAGGDVSGVFSSMSVFKLRGRVLADVAPSAGQVLSWDDVNSAWTPAALPTVVTDHGGLTGLADDDHTQYLLAGVRYSVDGYAVTGAIGQGTLAPEGAGTRLVWYPRKAAFRAGSVNGAQWDDANIGGTSTAFGFSTTASGVISTALGHLSVATGDVSTAMGSQTNASGNRASAFGQSTTASGAYSTAMGASSTASADYSTAMGFGSIASGLYSFASGYQTEATGNVSTAMGFQTNATGLRSTALGVITTASGLYSTTMGFQSAASGDVSTALGSNTNASGNRATAMGQSSTASGDYSTAMGKSTIASGDYSTAMGNLAQATGVLSTAIGNSALATAENAIAIGTVARATGVQSTAMGSFVGTNSKVGSFIIGDATASSTTITTSTADNQFTARFAGGYRFRSSADLTTGCNLPAGSGSWDCTSSRALKTGFEQVDGESLLEKLRAMPVMSWQYKGEPGSVRHIGPFAEDFRAAFGLGTSARSIGLLDAAGVSMAGVQALEVRTRELRAENTELRARLDRLEAMLSKLDERRP